MSITYEEALATLEAMFGAPWTRDTLDAVLRHEKGHMENTCDRILNHGSGDPQELIDRLKEGGQEPQVAIDEALARQLANGSTTRSQTLPKKKGRGTPTALPKDFLRIPGYKHRSAAAATTGGAAEAMDDETLARMLQDELFSEELARNPDFAHLARGSSSRRSGGRGVPPGQRRAQASTAHTGAANPFEGVNLMKNISELGDGARRRLQVFAANFEQRLNSGMNRPGNAGGTGASAVGAPRSSLGEDSGAMAERRGLLDNDDDEDMIEFETRKNQ